ncbi:MAG: ribosomal protein S16, small subunit ribosomal protein S16 [Candidatus Adlerbacteria bacterium GW2011_GWC1_50_9]|uniref:Small ribosomal subunit protein bS16 n=1 Tax=Candidatus Adlerbacteria bacterium GW2011_GWC1_50_9 TaxID=1618608 RepID=A0A0G1WQ86_9BACT|nr:MAG: ribosomal protein S16, small subunit ribosomal protein S16 [Candidatus Adlerbacteria bacterium GW2011_GWC1_50_9]
MRIWKYEDNGGTLTRRSFPSIVFLMLVIRFQRRGRTNDPAFRVVVTEKRSKPKSGELEILGSYHPKTKETLLKNERILYWMSKGAQASPTVHNLLVTKGVVSGAKVSVVRAPKQNAAEVPAA